MGVLGRIAKEAEREERETIRGRGWVISELRAED